MARVLIIDDEPALRDSLTYAFDREGLSPGAARRVGRLMRGLYGPAWGAAYGAWWRAMGVPRRSRAGALG